ncbi:N-acetylmuramoyl-L-alanine amidase [Streptosporangium sp. NPDC048047]|uniref:N-acetylmuramoyl-L-alanine amidase n=1 Tax=Streptosporangium sp. NPDC048047 TaxID=3155748 RepID=UPI0034416A2B
MTSKALATVLVACGLSAAACGGGAAAAGPARDAEPAPRAANPAAAPSGPATETTPATTATAARTTPPAAGSTPAKPLSGKTVVIDPGHNGMNYKYPAKINKQVDVLTQRKACDTTGTATDSGYSEAAFTWDVSRRLAKILESRGATVKLTRHGNDGVGPCITERAAIGNKAKADAAISIHADGAGPADHGFHVIIPKKIGGPVDPVVADSRRLGLDIRNAYRSGTGVPYSIYIGSKALSFRSDLGGLNLSTVPKVFIETGNMRNAGDAAKLKSAEFRQRAAAALAAGLQTYLK